MEEFSRKLGDQIQAFGMLPAGNLLGGFLFLHYFYMVFLRQIPQSLDIGIAFMLHDETYGSTGFSAAETFEDTLRRRDIEGRGLFVVKRTAGYEIRAPPLERNEVTHHILDLGRVQYFIDSFPRNHLPDITYPRLLSGNRHPWHR